jgi:hypothetical protein
LPAGVGMVTGRARHAGLTLLAIIVALLAWYMVFGF